MKSNKKKSNLRTSEPRKLLKTNSPFAVKEAYNAIRTNLLFTQQGEKCPVFVVTSPTANNGKTINSANTAISFAQMGKRTLIIDSDMRNPSLHKLFSLNSKNGLSEILAKATGARSMPSRSLRVFIRSALRVVASTGRIAARRVSKVDCLNT